MNILIEIMYYFLYKLIVAKRNVIKDIKKPFRKEQKYRWIYWIVLFVFILIFILLFIIKEFNYRMLLIFIFFVFVMIYYELQEFVKGEWKNFFRKELFGKHYPLIKKMRKGEDIFKEYERFEEKTTKE